MIAPLYGMAIYAGARLPPMEKLPRAGPSGCTESCLVVTTTGWDCENWTLTDAHYRALTDAKGPERCLRASAAVLQTGMVQQ